MQVAFMYIKATGKKKVMHASCVLYYVARKLHPTSASRFGTGIGIGTLRKLAESRFQNVSKIFSLKICWKLTIPFWNHASVLKKNAMYINKI